MDTAKTLRRVAFSVAALVVFTGAAMICSLVMRLSQVPPAQSNTAGTPSATDMTSAETAAAVPQPAPISTSDLYERAPERHSVRGQSPRSRAPASAPTQTPTQTAPVLLSPGTPRPLTPDGPVSSGEPAMPTVDSDPVPSAPPAPTPTVKATPSPSSERHTVTLFAGTPINISLWDTVSTEQAKKGSYFRAVLSSSIVRDGFIIAQAGSAVTGRVLESRRTGLLGRRPELRLTLSDIRTTDNQVVHIQTYQWDERGRSHHAVTAPFRSAFDVLAARTPGTLVLPPNTTLQFRLAAPVSIAERPH